MSSSYSASSDDYRSGSSSSTPSTIGYTAAVDGMYENQSENALDDRRFYRDDDLMDMLRKRPSSKRDIMHIDYADVSPRRWRTHYEPMKVPIMIHGMPEELGWAAPKKWTKKRLVREYGEVRFNIGAAPDHVKLKHYIKYCERDGEKVDAPVYLFDSDIQDREDSAALLDDFSNPAYFDQDHFKMIPETKRPDYRWLICGPARSGTTPHTDPNGTSAWNTLLVGRKRWCIFRPELSRKEVFGNGRKSMPKEEEAIHWFSDIFPTLKERGIEYWDVMQEAGETIFVPGMWWHVVVNVEFTVSITQNFASDANFDEVYTYTRQKRPRFNRRWLKLLKTEEPALFERAKELDVHEGSNGWSSTSSDWSEVDALPGPPTHPGCAFETWSFSSVFSAASGTSASSSSAASSSEKKSKKKKKGKKGKTKKAKGKSKGGKSKGSKAKAKAKGKKKGKKKVGKMG